MRLGVRTRLHLAALSRRARAAAAAKGRERPQDPMAAEERFVGRWPASSTLRRLRWSPSPEATDAGGPFPDADVVKN